MSGMGVHRPCLGEKRKVIDVSGIPLVPQRTFRTSGTTLKPRKSISPEI